MAQSIKTDDSRTSIGEPFARLYVERGAPAQDNKFFRNRLEAYLLARHAGDYSELATYLQQEGGLRIEISYLGNAGVYQNFPKFFADTPIEHVLSAVTFIWRFLKNKYSVWKATGKGLMEGAFVSAKADAWHAFVDRALREENMAYAVDERCGVHYFVDEEFEHNRISTLKCLDAARYSGVRAAFEAAHAKLEKTPPDTKGAIRDAFESAETLTKLISGSGKSLDARFVRTELEPRIQKLYERDAVARRSSVTAAQSFADWVDSAHPYRHGHEAESPIAPPLELGVLLVSQAASFIRWLVDLDRLLAS